MSISTVAFTARARASGCSEWQVVLRTPLTDVTSAEHWSFGWKQIGRSEGWFWDISSSPRCPQRVEEWAKHICIPKIAPGSVGWLDSRRKKKKHEKYLPVIPFRFYFVQCFTASRSQSAYGQQLRRKLQLLLMLPTIMAWTAGMNTNLGKCCVALINTASSFPLTLNMLMIAAIPVSHCILPYANR